VRLPTLAARDLDITDDFLILVDGNDREIGHAPKRRCHEGDGLLHRAFSVFLFDAQGRMLIQRRARQKPLWPGYWSNACCSHPRRGEDIAAAAQRRLGEELGLDRVPLTWLFRFEYAARYGEAGSERELCHVFFGRVDQPVEPNPEEIDGWRWRDVATLEREMADQPERFTPWFKLEWARIRQDHEDALRRYAHPEPEAAISAG